MAMVNEPIKTSSQPTSNTVDDAKDQLYKVFTDALNGAKRELAEVQVKVQQFDEKYEASSTVKEQGQKASQYLHTTFEGISDSLKALSEKAHHVLVEAQDFTLDTLKDLWKTLQDNIEKLRKLSIEFDEKYHVSERISDLTLPLLEQLRTFVKSLDHAGDAIKDATSSGRSYLIGSAAFFEHKYHIEDRLSGLDQKYKILERAKDLQSKGEEFLTKQHIIERVKQLDEKFTGSKAGEILEQGVKLVSSELGKVQQEYESAKAVEQESVDETKD